MKRDIIWALAFVGLLVMSIVAASTSINEGSASTFDGITNTGTIISSGTINTSDDVEVTDDLRVNDDVDVLGETDFHNNVTIEDPDTFLTLKETNGGTNWITMYVNSADTNTGEFQIYLFNSSGASQGYFQIKGQSDFAFKNLTDSNLLTIDGATGNTWIAGDMSALSITDRTAGPKDTVNVIAELMSSNRNTENCNGNKCQIDKSALPDEMVRSELECVEWDLDGNCTVEEIVLVRDLTYTVSHLWEQNRVQQETINDLEERIDALEALLS